MFEMFKKIFKKKERIFTREEIKEVLKNVREFDATEIREGRGEGGIVNYAKKILKLDDKKAIEYEKNFIDLVLRLKNNLIHVFTKTDAEGYQITFIEKQNVFNEIEAIKNLNEDIKKVLKEHERTNKAIFVNNKYIYIYQDKINLYGLFIDHAFLINLRNDLQCNCLISVNKNIGFVMPYGVNLRNKNNCPVVKKTIDAIEEVIKRELKQPNKMGLDVMLPIEVEINLYIGYPKYTIINMIVLQSTIFKTISEFCEHERDNIASYLDLSEEFKNVELEDVVLNYCFDLNNLVNGEPNAENKKLNIYQCYVTHTSIFILINGILIFQSTKDKI